jgi:aspartyl-tRNA(Asn)/glutamyl-tRNA(Gln) amidotransferase subunit C
VRGPGGPFDVLVGRDPSPISLPAVPDRLTNDAVAKVARLARLDLTPAELERATHQLGDMLEHFADIDALDLADVEPLNQPYPLANVLRDDVEQPCLDRDEVLAAAPKSEDGRFWVPPILGGAS